MVTAGSHTTQNGERGDDREKMGEVMTGREIVKYGQLEDHILPLLKSVVGEQGDHPTSTLMGKSRGVAS